MIRVNYGRSMSPDEIVAFLTHSSLPAVLVEGKDDMRVFSFVEREHPGMVTVVNCGGRNTLFEVFKRRSEFSSLPTAFLADSDMFLFSDIPNEYREGIVFTRGYSIENDVIAGSRIFSMYTENTISLYEDIKRELVRWWAFEIEEHFAGRATCCDVHVRSLIENLDSSPKLRIEAFCNTSRTYKLPDERLIESIMGDFELKMRGHQLCDVHRILLQKVTDGSVKTKPDGLMEVLVTLAPSEHIERIANELAHDLGFDTRSVNWRMKQLSGAE